MGTCSIVPPTCFLPVVLTCQHHCCASGMNADPGTPSNHTVSMPLPLPIRNSPELQKCPVRKTCVEVKSQRRAKIRVTEKINIANKYDISI